MLAKIHLKTACGCEKTFFESRVPQVYWGYKVPIQANRLRQGCFVGPRTVYKVRDFTIVRYEFKSNNRVEVWYEEVVCE